MRLHKTNAAWHGNAVRRVVISLLLFRKFSDGLKSYAGHSCAAKQNDKCRSFFVFV